MAKRRAMLLLTIVALCGALGLSRPLAAAPVDDLHALFEDEWQMRLAENPIFATSQGVRDFDDRLAGVSPADQDRRLEADRAFLARLDAIPRNRLNAEDQLNYDLFHFLIENRIGLAEFRPWRIPFLSDDGFFIDVARMADFFTIRNQQDVSNYNARLRDISRFFRENIENMRAGIADGFTMPRIIMDGIMPSVQAHAESTAENSVFMTPVNKLPDSWGARKAAAREAILTTISGEVIPAYRQLYRFFVDTYIPRARQTVGAKDLPDGDRYYRFLVRYYTTLDLTPEEVHDIGLKEVARIRREMEGIIADVNYQGSFADFLEFLRTDPQFYAKTPHQLLAEASYIAKRIDYRLPGFFGHLPSMPYGVEPVPADIAPNYTSGRYVDAPVHGDHGGAYWVNTFALDKRPLYALPSLTLHEAVPGHHLQGAIAAELTDLPNFRRVMYAHAFGEGWGLYSEWLGQEMGIYETPYQHFGRLTYEIWRAGRLVVDTGLHAFGWGREQARALFLDNSALSTREIQTEVDRYIAWPGQALAYKIGEMKIKELRSRAETALGDRFDIRAFHDAVLSAGAIPLPVLEQRIDEFIRDAATD